MINLLRQLLTLNPSDRLSAKQLLMLEVFDDIRDEAHLVSVSQTIDSEINEQKSSDNQSRDPDLLQCLQILILKESKKVRSAKLLTKTQI